MQALLPDVQLQAPITHVLNTVIKFKITYRNVIFFSHLIG